MLLPIFFLLSLFCLSLIPQQPSKQDGQIKPNDETIRIKTDLVSLPISVKDKNGRYVFDLLQKDFTLYEDGVEQKIEHFSTFESPVHVVLLLDTSKSTEYFLQGIKDSAAAFLNQLGLEDQIYPFVFDNEVTPLVPTWTRDQAVLLREIEQVHTGKSITKIRPANPIVGKTVVYYVNTRLFDAVKTGLDEVEKIKGRKAIIVFSDGLDTASKRASEKSTLQMVEESDALVYTIRYTSQGRRVAPDDPVGTFGDGKSFWAQRYMERLAQNSGGRFFEVVNNEQVQNTFMAIAEELRHQYSLGYYPTSAINDKPRKIVVKVSRKDLVVNARTAIRLKFKMNEER